MNRKTENEFKQLVKLGVPEETAKLIAVSKHNPESEESKYLIEEEKEFQNEIQRFISEFKKIEEESKEEKLICLNDIFG
jgi:inorganic pyrophosphatase